jgi:hypothetical protein
MTHDKAVDYDQLLRERHSGGLCQSALSQGQHKRRDTGPIKLEMVVLTTLISSKESRDHNILLE